MTSVCVFPLPDHVVDAINEFCSQDVHIRFGDKQVYRCRAFLDRLCMDGAEVAAAQSESFTIDLNFELEC